MNRATVWIAPLALLAGCFTVGETPLPKPPTVVHIGQSTNITVKVQGFAATLTGYVTIDGYQTFYGTGCPRYGGGFVTGHTTTTVPKECPTDAFLEMAKSTMEEAGFNIMANSPDYTVEARFTGPEYTNVGEDTLWMILSLFTYERTEQTWRAKLKIHDNRTGRLLFTHDYEQKYAVGCFSPLPILGISSFDKSGSNYMQSWCLGVLTARISADAAAFLAQTR